jgi:hypothetical protein
MEDPSILTVNYKAVDKVFNARLLLQGYTHKIKVQIGETEVFFEPDEEGGYRAIKMPWQEQKEPPTGSVLIGKTSQGVISNVN